MWSLIISSVAAAFGVVHIILSIYSALGIDWVILTVYDGPQDDHLVSKNRTRGLMYECLDGARDACTSLEITKDKSLFDPTVHPILDLRTASFTLSFISAAFSGVVYIVGGLVYLCLRRRPSAKQIHLLVLGVLTWISAILMFVSLLAFLEVRNNESFRYDPHLANARSSWGEELVDATTEEYGEGFYLAISSCCIAHAGSFLLFVASLCV